MSNIFQEVINDADGVEQKLLGPTYPYYKNIKTPSQIGMSDNGTLQQMGDDINGLIQYVELLVSGNSQASATGGPLGNKFFLKTGAKCLAKDSCKDPNDSTTCQQVDRYMYVNNVPEGNIPFISSGLGVNFTEFRGLIPGAMGNLNVLNPYGIMRSFLSGSTPPCQEITMQTINNDNISSSESHYVTVADITGMDPCSFPNGVNPVSGNRCSETFKSSISDTNDAHEKFTEDAVDQLYFASLACVGIYILYRLMEKSR
jgi:hypothetical protein